MRPERILHALASVVLSLVGAVVADVRLEIPTPGSLGRRTIEKLANAPEDLGRRSSRERNEWADAAQASIVAASHAAGRLEATCGIEFILVDSAGNAAKVLVAYEEGALYRFAAPRLRFLGDSGMETPRSLPIEAGDVYSQKLVSELLQTVVEFYRRRGWLDASATHAVSIDTLTDSVRMDVDIALGRIAVYGGISTTFEGKHLTDTTFLRDLWGVEEGDTMRSEALSKFNRKLYRTRLFSSVRTEREPMDGDSSRTRIDLVLKERAPGTIEGAVSWEPTFGWGLEGMMRHRNFFGRFHEFSVMGNVAEREQHLRGGYATPLLFGTPIALDYGLTAKQQAAGLVDPQAVREFSLTNEGTFSYPPTDWASVSLTLNTERLTKYYESGDWKVLYQYQVILGGLLDFRDEPFDPIAGWTLRGVVGNGGQFGFDSTYSWVQSQGKAWVPLFWRFVSAAAVEGGMFLNSTTVDGAGIFWQGGGRSVRSFKYNEAKVVPADGRPLRPRYVRASGELRLNLPWNLQVVEFQDWARLWNDGEDPDLDKLSKAWLGYGVGLRYRISLLSLRLDYSLGRGSERWAFDLAQAI